MIAGTISLPLIVTLILSPIGFGIIVGWLGIANWRDRLPIDLIYIGLGFAGVLYLVAWDVFSHQCSAADLARASRGGPRSCAEGSVVAPLVGATTLLVGSVVGRAYADRWSWMFKTSGR